MPEALWDMRLRESASRPSQRRSPASGAPAGSPSQVGASPSRSPRPSKLVEKLRDQIRALKVEHKFHVQDIEDRHRNVVRRLKKRVALERARRLEDVEKAVGEVETMRRQLSQAHETAEDKIRAKQEARLESLAHDNADLRRRQNQRVEQLRRDYEARIVATEHRLETQIEQERRALEQLELEHADEVRTLIEEHKQTEAVLIRSIEDGVVSTGTERPLTPKHAHPGIWVTPSSPDRTSSPDRADELRRLVVALRERLAAAAADNRETLRRNDLLAQRVVDLEEDLSAVRTRVSVLNAENARLQGGVSASNSGFPAMDVDAEEAMWL